LRNAARGSLHAEKADREKPITFTSDDGEVNYEKRTGVLKGNVVITQGTMTIKADRINFKQNADNSLSATVFGNPLAFRQKRDGAEGYYEGWAQRAEYDGPKEQLELFDNAILKRGADEIRSNYISYNSATEAVQGGRAPVLRARRRWRHWPQRSGARLVPAKKRRRPRQRNAGQESGYNGPATTDAPAVGRTRAAAK
jgi:lipopolysaccharide export system protein LptA